MHYFIAILTGDPLKYKMGNSIIILSTCMKKSIEKEKG